MQQIRKYNESEIVDLIKQALGQRRKGFRPIKVLHVALKQVDPSPGKSEEEWPQLVAEVEFEEVPREKKDED